MTTATGFDLRALFLQAHARGFLYPKMSNTELRKALRRAAGDDEAFDAQFTESVGNFRDYRIKPLVRLLTPYGYGFSFEQASYVYIGGLDRDAPTFEQPTQEPEIKPFVAPAPKYQPVTGIILRSYGDGTVIAQLGSRDDLEHEEFNMVISAAKEALGLTHGAYNAYRNQFVFRLALLPVQHSQRDVEAALVYAYALVGKTPATFQHETTTLDYPYYNEVR